MKKNYTQLLFTIKHLTFCILIFFFTIKHSKGQDYKSKIAEGTWTIQQIQQSADSFFSKVGTGKGSGYTQYKRWEYNAQRLADEQGYLKSTEFLQQEWEKSNREFNTQRLSRRGLNEIWTEMGPSYYNATTSWSPGVGRVTSFSVDPSNHKHIIIGAETGGVWRTIDGGQTWVPLGDYFSNLSVYATAIHPNNKSVYFFGSNNGYLYRSSNAGATWHLLSKVGNSNINNILLSTIDSLLIFVSVEASGMYRSADGGKNFVKITNDPSSFDILYKPLDYSTVYASGIGFHISTDTGKTFQSYMPNFPLTITGDVSVNGNYFITDNGFSPGKIPIPEEPSFIYGKLVLLQDSNNHLACGQALNASELNNSIAVVRRGTCNFTEKVMHAQNAGAIAVLVVNNQGGSITMGGGNGAIQIPAVSIDMETGEKLIHSLNQNNDIFAKIQNSSNQNLFTPNPKMIGLSEHNPELIYVLESKANVFGALFKSTNGGASFVKLLHSQNFLGYSTDGDDNAGQAPRDMAIAVNPLNSEEVHIAGILTWRSIDGGQSFDCSSDWIPYRAAQKGMGYCHADVDILKFVGDTLYAGTDGGIFYAENTVDITPNYFTDITNGLGIRQFYKIGIAQHSDVVVSGGSQDNGTSFYTPQNGWKDWLGADGMETFVSKLSNENDILFGTSQNGRPYVTYDAGNSIEYLSLPGTQSGNWVTPFEQSPNGQYIYIGYEQVFESEVGSDNWQPISQVFPGKLNHLKIAENNPKTMFAAHQRNLYKKDSLNNQWPLIKEFVGSINFIAIHPLNENLIAVSTTDTGKVYISYDGGENWVGFKKNLPDFSALCLAWNKDTFQSLYVGMNYGIYYIDSLEENWIPFSNQLPNVIVNELEINYVTNKIYAGTYGRGLWESSVFIREIEEEPNDTLNVTKQSIAAFAAYPNPFGSEIKIQNVHGNLKIQSIEVFDLQGKIIVSQKNINQETYTLATQNLPKGVYFIKIGSSKGVSIVKGIKE
jgi:photosystem II stability/assembly factor-like uncharacterized protein